MLHAERKASPFCARRAIVVNGSEESAGPMLSERAGIGFLRPTAPRRLLADDPKASVKCLLVEPPPQLGAVADVGRPLLVESRQVGFERTPQPQEGCRIRVIL